MRAMKKNFIWVLIASLSAHSCIAQNFPYKKYTEADGLAHSTVFRIMQDKRGFLFFSTDNGISIFDGKSFKNYFSFRHRSVLSVSEKSTGEKILSTPGGIDILSNNKVSAYSPRYGKMPTAKILFAEEDGETTWIITSISPDGELHRIRHDSILPVLLKTPQGKPIHVYKMKKENSRVLFCTGQGIFFSAKGADPLPFFEQVIRQPVYDITGSENDYWVGLSGSVIHTDGQKIISRFSTRENLPVNKILQDHAKNIWLLSSGTHLGIIQKNIYQDISEKLPSANIMIDDIYEDTEYNIWLATHGDGVYRISYPEMGIFQPAENKLGVYASVLLPYKNEILCGSFGIVSIIKDKRISKIPVATLKSNHYIYFLNIIGEDLYVGIPTGVIKKNLVSGRESFIQCDGGVSFLGSASDKILVGGFTGIGFLSDDNWIRMDFPMLRDKKITSLYEEPSHLLWVGTDNGLYSLRDGVCSKIQIDNTDAGIHVNSILPASNGDIYFACNEGLLRRRNSKWLLLTSKNGLEAEKCNALKEGRSSALWIGTQKGLNRLDLNSDKIISYHTGLYPNEILSLAEDNDGNLMIGMVNGIFMVKEQLNESLPIPPLYITAVTYGNNVIEFPGFIKTEAGSKIIIDYVGISYRYPLNIEYRYRLSDSEDSMQVTRNTSVEIPSPLPGTYDFQIQARVNGGTWGEIKKLKIEVPPFFWQTLWFKALCVIACILGLFFLIRAWFIHRNKKYRNALLVEEKINHLRQQALTALINPHFIFNSLNSVQYFINRNKKEEAGKYMTKFARLIRLTLEQAMSTYIKLADEVERLTLYLELEKLRCGDVLVFDINTDPSLLTINPLIPNMVIQPFVENAVWHGIMPESVTGGLLQLSFLHEGNNIVIIIADNGKGIGHALNKIPESRSSMGINLTMERMSLLSQTEKKVHKIEIKDRSVLDPGTTGTLVEITIPLKLADPIIDAVPSK